MRKRLTNNLGLKFLALICAFFLWLVVININDPVDSAVFTGIQVEMINTDAITDEGKVYEVLDNTNVITVTVRAKRSILNTLGKENIRAVADMSEVTITNTVSIKLSTNRYNSSLDSIDSNTEYLRLNIEDVRRKQLVIDTTTTGSPAEGYLVGEVTSDQNLVRLSGPESIIAEIASAQAVVEVGGMSEDISTNVELRLYDSEGNQIRNDSITSNISSINVNVVILATKSVPLTYTTMGTPADGYVMTGTITGSVESVLVAGSRETLDALSVIEIPDTALNVTGQTEDMNVVLNVRDYLPSGVTLADPSFNGSITVLVEIARTITKQLTITQEQITLENIPEGYEASIIDYNESSHILVSGISVVLDDVNSSGMSGTVDISAYFEDQGVAEPVEGLYVMPVEFIIPADVVQTQNLSVAVQLTLIESEEEQEQE